MTKWWLGVVVAGVVAGCGYQFPGEQPIFPSWVVSSSLQVENTDPWVNPALAAHLEYRLRQRISGGQMGHGDGEIHVKLLPRKDTVLTVQTTGLALRQEVVLRAEVTVRRGDKPIGPPLATVTGRALFSEPVGSNPLQSRTGRDDAESEAMDRLVETITAVLAGMP